MVRFRSLTLQFLFAVVVLFFYFVAGAVHVIPLISGVYSKPVQVRLFFHLGVVTLLGGLREWLIS
jgi:hypothetical protein